jgi:hypothetical protein
MSEEGIGGVGRNRTGVDGFADRCVTTPPRRLSSRALGAGLETRVNFSFYLFDTPNFLKAGVDREGVNSLLLAKVWQQGAAAIEHSRRSHTYICTGMGY